MSKKKKKIICAAVLLALLVSAAAYTVFLQPLLTKEKWVYKDKTVERGALTEGVTESGTLEYGITSQVYNLDLSVEDSDEDDEEEETTQKYLKVEEVYVAAGQRIEEGDPLLKFTDASVSAVRRLLSAALTDAEVAYSEAQSEYNLSILSAELTYKAETTGAAYAGSIYTYTAQSVEDAIAGLRAELSEAYAQTEDLQEAYEEAAEDLDDLEEACETAKSDWEEQDGYYQKKIDAQELYLQAKATYESAKNKVEQAQRAIEENQDKITSLEEQIASAEAKQKIERLEAKQAYEESRLDSEVAEVNYRAEQQSLAETLQDAEEELADVREKLEAFEAFVGEEGIVYAAGSGMVTLVGYAAGDSLTAAGTVISFAQAQDMTITVEVTQEDIVDLGVGDTVKIQFTAYEDTDYEGVITAMDTMTTSGDSTVSYPVTIRVLGDTDALYDGMTADVTFVTAEREDTLFVTRSAIVEQNGKTYVYTDGENGEKVLTEVQTGLRNGLSVEIVSGLSEGQTYYIASRVSEEVQK